MVYLACHALLCSCWNMYAADKGVLLTEQDHSCESDSYVRLAYEDPMTPHVGMVRNSGSILNATMPFG